MTGVHHALPASTTVRSAARHRWSLPQESVPALFRGGSGACRPPSGSVGPLGIGGVNGGGDRGDHMYARRVVAVGRAAHHGGAI